jgi:hypothetical protein
MGGLQIDKNVILVILIWQRVIFCRLLFTANLWENPSKVYWRLVKLPAESMDEIGLPEILCWNALYLEELQADQQSKLIIR